MTAPRGVLLTGAGGFAGSHCLEHLLVNTNWQVVCLDSFRHRGKTDRISEVIEAHPIYRNRVTVITHDLTAPLSSQMADRIGHIDYILAYASESHVDRAIADPVPFVMNNTAVMLNTLEYARLIKPEAFVHVSTDEVYGPIKDGDAPFKEWDTILPSNPYSGSKAAQEAIGISYWRTYNVPLLIVNCMNLIGERQGEKFVPLVINACLKGHTVTIHGSENNVGSRHYLHARNLADGILFLLRKQTPAPYHQFAPSYDVRSADRPDRYHIASPDRIDNLSLAQMIAGFTGKLLKYKFEEFPAQRPGHDPHYGLDSTKILGMGWNPPVAFEASLKKTVEWYLQHPEWLED